MEGGTGSLEEALRHESAHLEHCLGAAMLSPGEDRTQWGLKAFRLGLWEGNEVPLVEGKQDPSSPGTKRLTVSFNTY